MKLIQLNEAFRRPAFPAWSVDRDNLIASCNGYNIRSLKSIEMDKDDFDFLYNYQDISLDISDNGLTSLEGLPLSFSSYQDVDAGNNKLKSCKGLPDNMKTLWIHNNQIESVKRDIVPYFESLAEISLSGNPVEKGALLSLFKVPGLQSITLTDQGVQRIFNKYLKIEDRGVAEMLDCQSDLIEAGYDAQAKL